MDNLKTSYVSEKGSTLFDKFVDAVFCLQEFTLRNVYEGNLYTKASAQYAYETRLLNMSKKALKEMDTVKMLQLYTLISPYNVGQ